MDYTHQLNLIALWFLTDFLVRTIEFCDTISNRLLLIEDLEKLIYAFVSSIMSIWGQSVEN